MAGSHGDIVMAHHIYYCFSPFFIVCFTMIFEFLAGSHSHYRHEHLLHGYAAMLECAVVVLHIIGIIVGICEVILIAGVDE